MTELRRAVFLMIVEGTTSATEHSDFHGENHWSILNSQVRKFDLGNQIISYLYLRANGLGYA